MADDRTVRTCPACGHTHIGAPLAPKGLPTMHICPVCRQLVAVRDLGEMHGPHERADPDEWGTAGWM